MFRRHLPAVAAAILTLVAVIGVQPGFGAEHDDPAWTSSLRTGDVVPRGTVWRVTVSPTPDEVEFWASGRVIGTDRVAPFETPLNLAPGEHKIGFCHRKDGALQCETTETGVNTGVVARVTITDAPSPSPEPTADTTPPTVPGSVRVTSAAATKLTMAWAPSTDDTAVADYGQYRESSRIATTTKTSATFGNLTCGTAYVLGVDAADAAGNRSQRADMTATTAACADTAAPSPPTNVVVGTRTGTSVALSWTSATDDTGIVDYGLYRDGARVSTTSGTTGIVSGLTCGTSYTLGIDASDAAGNRSERATVMVSTLDCGDTEAPTAPSALAASSITQTGMTLGWVAATDNIGVSSYAVYRDGIALGQTSSLTYPVTGLACGTSYTFVVTAQDAAGNVSPTGTSLTVSAASCPDTQPPTAPTNLVVSTPSQTSLTLTWAPGSDDVGVVGYSVYRDDTPLGETSDLTYKVSGLTCGTSYVLAVESRDAAGLVSTQRATLTASTAACATPPSSGNKLPWAPPALSNPTTIKVTNQNSRLFLSAGKDYVIDMPSSPLTASGGLWLIGGRNVVVIGGEISDNSPISSGTSVDEAYGIYLKGQTGTVHLEGLWVHGRGIGQALVMDESEGATVQVEHCRFETLHPVGYVHTDGIQSWAGPNRLLVNELTIKTAGVGLQTQPRQYSNVAIAGWEYRHVDIEHLTPDAYALWKDTSSAWWPEVHQDFWLKTNPNHVAADYHSAWAGGNDWKGWNPGGGKGVTGEWINLGLHPGGDFVPSGSVGTAYVSPGYQ